MVVKVLGDALDGTCLAGRAGEMPESIGWEQVVANRPGPEWVSAQEGGQLGTAHADVAGARRHRTGGQPGPAFEKGRVIPSHAGDDLPNRIQGERSRPAPIQRAPL